MPVRIGLKEFEAWGSKSSMEYAVRKYEEEPIIKGQIVFYGPSNYTRWSESHHHVPLRQALLGKSGAECCINRGFGSSCAEHHLYYYSRMVRPLEPKVLVYSSFGNGEDFGYTSEETWEIGQRVVEYALADFPDIKIYLAGVQNRRNMTPERYEMAKKYDEYLIEYAKTHPRCKYLNFIDRKDMNNEELYVGDGVHFNQKGYDLYADYFREALKEELERF